MLHMFISYPFSPLWIIAEEKEAEEEGKLRQAERLAMNNWLDKMLQNIPSILAHGLLFYSSYNGKHENGLISLILSLYSVSSGSFRKDLCTS